MGMGADGICNCARHTAHKARVPKYTNGRISFFPISALRYSLCVIFELMVSVKVYLPPERAKLFGQAGVDEVNRALVYTGLALERGM